VGDELGEQRTLEVVKLILESDAMEIPRILGSTLNTHLMSPIAIQTNQDILQDSLLSHLHRNDYANYFFTVGYMQTADLEAEGKEQPLQPSVYLPTDQYEN
jgi:hypothetical protein